MIVAIASGKGGTGKTMLAVNLALSFDRPVQLLDCDVEAPNAHLYLRPEIVGREAAGVLVPRVEADRCSLCGDCGQLCAFNALAVLPDRLVVFPELCHGCGGCFLVCPEGAIREELREIGVVEWGRARGVELVTGRLNVGEALAPPVIRAVTRRARSDRLVLVDAPPGTTCPTVAAVSGSDLVVLVTEPTPFGLNDLALAVEMVRALERPFVVVVNRVGAGDDRVHRFCSAEGIEVLAEIPDDRRVAETSARGRLLVDVLEPMRTLFGSLAEKLDGRLAEGGELKTAPDTTALEGAS